MSCYAELYCILRKNRWRRSQLYHSCPEPHFINYFTQISIRWYYVSYLAIIWNYLICSLRYYKLDFKIRFSRHEIYRLNLNYRYISSNNNLFECDIIFNMFWYNHKQLLYRGLYNFIIIITIIITIIKRHSLTIA